MVTQVKGIPQLPKSSPTRVYKVAKESDVRIVFRSLRPNTIHNFYFNGEKVVNYVKQVGKKLGENLVSDDNGELEVIFYINADTDTSRSSSNYFKQTNLPSGPKEIVLTTVNMNYLPLSWSRISFSHATVTLN